LLSVTGCAVSSLPGCRQSVGHVQDPAVLNALDLSAAEADSRPEVGGA